MIHLLLARTLKELCIAGLNREKGLRESEEEKRTRQTEHSDDQSPAQGRWKCREKPDGHAASSHRGSKPAPSTAVVVISILDF